LNHKNKELIFIDGRSTDNTRKIINSRISSGNIKLLDNPHMTVPFALNLGIKESIGDIIIRMDAHTYYALDYVDKILNIFDSTEVDVVGGPTRIASGNTFQNSVGFAISSPLGIGNSKVHDANFKGYTDHVTFGAWKKEIFDEIGLFDETLKRNQDDEFHYRAKSKGKKIYQDPDIRLWYHPRQNLKSLFLQYFNYGLYKPLVLMKIKSETKLRHLIPSIFLIYLFLIPFYLEYPLLFLPLLIYFSLITYMVFSPGTKIQLKLNLYLIYPAIHISYGAGFILCLLKLLPSKIFQIIRCTYNNNKYLLL
jgi:glycosyltransferase involved in cell wall biosynthesis